MRLHELLEAIDGQKSPLTDPGSPSWHRDKLNIFNWFKRPFLTNGPKGNYRLPIRKKGKK